MKYYVSALLFVFLITFASAGNTEGYYLSEDNLIEVMFVQGARLRCGILIDISNSGVLDGLEEVLASTTGYQWERISTVAEEDIDEMESSGELLTDNDLYNLNNIYRLRFQGDMDVWELAEMLQELPGIISAMPVPLPQPLPQPPNYQSSQGYLNAASLTPTGIDAIYAWTQPGGDGLGVTVCDLEYSWNYSHADLTKAPGSQINSQVQDPFGNNNHGTAVIGEMVSDFNGWGTTGICYGANLKTCGTYYGTSPQWNVAGAIIVAISNLSAGDVILLEQQWDYTGSGGYVPIEWWLNYSPNPQTYNAVYAAIQTAVASGIHVVQAGGNGNINTGSLNWFGDNGSMIIGAGGAYAGGPWPAGDLQRLSYSSYGPRFDLQGWGEDVVTTGYSDLYSAMGPNYYYTATFSGTSSASPIVAGAAACCVGYWIANGNPASTLTPALLRSTLVNTGTLQIFPPAGNIGPRPNLMGAFAYLYSVGISPIPESCSSVAMSVFPNPASVSVTIEMFASSDMISLQGLAIYDITGRKVASFSNSVITAGESIIWDCRDSSGSMLPGGLYTATGIYDSGSVSVPFIILSR
ncbi:MAG: S8 family peptidase [Candidatus Aegiribacteria sp.]|nr:S8 family peptidase [Candidatus Aegiribacteria sp.]